MKKYNKYIGLLLVVILGLSVSAFAEGADDTGGTGPLPPVYNNDGKPILGGAGTIRQETNASIEAARKARLQQEEEARRARNEEIVKMRLDARAKIESGEMKPSEAYKELNSEAKDLREKTREDIKKIRDDFKSAVMEDRDKAREMLGEKRDDLIQAIQNKRDLFKQEFEANKDAMEAKREEMKAKFQADLLKIKDEAKRARVENISLNFDKINITVTTRASGVVDQIEAVLLAIESRTDKVAVGGADVANVRALISAADTAIADARAAIAVQVGKTYEASITSDATVKSSLQSTRDQFKKDIEVMKTKVKAAHDAVRKAAEALKAIPNVDEEVSASAEANTN